MQVKLIEIRDRGTCLSALAIRPAMPERLQNPSDADAMDADDERQAQWRHHLGRCGFSWGAHIPPRAILFGDMNGRKPFNTDPYDWNDRTWTVAHMFVEEHFDELVDGQVVDVRVINGETAEPALPDRHDAAAIIAGRRP